jgi:iron complex transport system substrate-binding protein
MGLFLFLKEQAFYFPNMKIIPCTLLLMLSGVAPAKAGAQSVVLDSRFRGNDGNADAPRVVSLLPSNTEILESLGAGGEIVGTTRYDAILKREPRIKNVGDFMQPNMETIVSLRPDLIVAGLWTSSHVVPRLRAMGIQVLEVRNPRSLDELYQTIRDLAHAVKRDGAAGPVIADMKQRLENVQKNVRGRTPVSVYVEIDQPYWTLGGHDFLTEALALAGAENVFADMDRPSAPVSPETIIRRNPEVIISFQASRQAISQRPGWSSIRAVRNHHVIDDLSQDRLSRPSPQLVEGIEALAAKIAEVRPR